MPAHPSPERRRRMGHPRCGWSRAKHRVGYLPDLLFTDPAVGEKPVLFNMDKCGEASADAWIAALGEYGDFGRRYVLDPIMLPRALSRSPKKELNVAAEKGRMSAACSRDMVWGSQELLPHAALGRAPNPKGRISRGCCAPLLWPIAPPERANSRCRSNRASGNRRWLGCEARRLSADPISQVSTRPVRHRQRREQQWPTPIIRSTTIFKNARCGLSFRGSRHRSHVHGRHMTRARLHVSPLLPSRTVHQVSRSLSRSLGVYRARGFW